MFYSITMRRSAFASALVALFVMYSGQASAGVWGLENWGAMLWGDEGVSVPFLPIASMALLAGILLGITHKYGARRFAPFLLVLMTPFIAISMPNLVVFQNGTVADADQVNQNFAEVLGAIDPGAFTVPGIDSQDNIVTIPIETINSLCKDGDGCRFRFCFTNGTLTPWCSFNRWIAYNYADPNHFETFDIDGGATTATGLSAEDGDNSVNSVQQLGACGFGDADSVAPLEDTQPGWAIWNTGQTSVVSCVLQLED